MASREFMAICLVGVCVSFATKLEGVIHGHDIMDSGSGYDTNDEDFLEMSGDSSPTSLCQRQEIEASVRKHPETFVAKCSKEGEFEVEQCHQDQCWCVTQYGLEIAETRHPSSLPFSCLDFIEKLPSESVGVIGTRQSSVYPSNMKTTTALPFIANPKTDDVTIDETKEDVVEISLSNPNSIEYEASMLERKATSSPSKIPIHNKPILLAAIIGGTALSLLCVVLFFMFLVYRMRKKDEGSYALDEPKALPSSDVRKLHSREFFA